MQQQIKSLASENERQCGIILGLEQMVEEAGTEKLQLLKYVSQTQAIFRCPCKESNRYCHELELRALTVEVMKENPSEERSDRSDVAVLLELQQVRVFVLCFSVCADIFTAAGGRFCSFVLPSTATNVSPTPRLS